MIFDDNPGMLMFISLVVREPYETAFAIVAVEAIIAPPEVRNDALRGRIQCHRVVWCLSGSELYGPRQLTEYDLPNQAS